MLNEITCVRCGCEGRRPFAVGTNFCNKCCNEDDMMKQIKHLESGLDCLIQRIASNNIRRDKAYSKTLVFIRGMSEGGNRNAKLLLAEIGEE